MNGPLAGIRISPRSRRLRVCGLIFLLSVILMSGYGLFVLMPSLSRSVHSRTQMLKSALPANVKASIHHAALAQVAFAYGYWLICFLLLAITLFIAWLDWREVAKTYLVAQKDLIQNTVGRSVNLFPPDEDR